MSKARKDPLFQLIKALTKSEKRNFKLYANRINTKGEAKFIQLFDLIDQQSSYNEGAILQKGTDFKPGQLSNLKGHLYRQILTSLRLNHVQQNLDIEIRENIDYAKILYNKGLYLQSLKLLDRIKLKAKDAYLHHLHLEIVEFEKLIETQYITHSRDNRADQLTEEAESVNKVISLLNQLSNLALSLYDLYLKVGHVRDRKDYELVKHYYYSRLPDFDFKKLSFHEKLYLYQSRVWYNDIVQNFPNGYRNARYWVELFEAQPEMKHHNMVLYIKGLYHLLFALFNIRAYDQYGPALEKLQSLKNDPEIKLSDNDQAILFLYTYLSLLNKHFLFGTFTEGLKIIPSLLKELEIHQSKLDEHWILVFYYKIASIYFGSGDCINAIRYLNMIINMKDSEVGGDIQCFARILSLIAHFELNNHDLLDYQVKSVYRFLAKMDNLQKVQMEILAWLKNLRNILPEELPSALHSLKNRLVEIWQDPLERRPFLYLDIISWLESKIEGVPVEMIIHEKALREMQEKKVRSRIH